MRDNQTIGRQDVINDNRINKLDWNNISVELRNVDFRYRGYRSGEALKDVTMTVPKSSIYALLGPSGCGKTSVLRVILGRLCADRGSVRVEGKKPGSTGSVVPGVGVGYMPQDIALYSEFSVFESLSYFAKIYGMRTNHINERIKFLKDLLDLPELNRKIEHLSFGEKRRVSLSVALIHSPSLLILDEPTVGVDPLLRERIWKHVTALAERTTIIMTTHYIEEAKRADIVSFMINGRLLIEHSPTFLMRHFRTHTIEKVFLMICQHRDLAELEKLKLDIKCSKLSENAFDIKEVNFRMSSNNSSKLMVESRNAKPSQHCFLRPTVYNKLNALIEKNFRKITRNTTKLLFQLEIPTIILTLGCLCLGTPLSGLNVAVVNQELMTNSSDIRFEQIFLNLIDKNTITLNTYNSLDSAMDCIRAGLCWGVVVIKQDFTDAIITRLMTPIVDIIDDAFLENSFIEYFGDFTDIQISLTIFKTLINASQTFELFLIKQFKDSAVNPKSVHTLLNFNAPPVYGSLEQTYQDYVASGVIIFIMFVHGVGLSGGELLDERKEGLIERSMVSGVRVYEMIISNLFVYFVILAVNTASMLFMAFQLFAITNNGSIILVVCLTLLQGFVGVSMGVFISSICDRKESALFISVSISLPTVLLSGVVWPLEAMPSTLQSFSHFLPHTLAIHSMRDIMLRGRGLDHSIVCLGFVSTVIWICIFLMSAFIVLRFVRK